MLMKLEEVLTRTKKRNNSMIALTVNMRRRMQIRKIRGVTGMMRKLRKTSEFSHLDTSR